MVTFQNYYDDLALRCQMSEFNYLAACSNSSLSSEAVGKLKMILDESLSDFSWFMWYVYKFNIEPEDKLVLN